MRAINLLPADERRKGLEEGARTPLLVAAGGIVLITIAATFFASMASVDASGTRSDVEAIESAIDALPDPPDEAVSEGMLVQERTNRTSALASALSNRVPFDNLLRQISFVLPNDVWLTQLDATAPVTEAEAAAVAPAVDGGTSDVTIQGATWSHQQIAVALARLAAVPVLEDVRLTGSTLTEPSPGAIATPGQPVRPFVTFVVAASLRTEKTQETARTEETDPTDTTETTEGTS
jgi:Tfp pilus assembly protein PilN